MIRRPREMFLRRARGEPWAEEQRPYWKQRGWQLSAGFLGLVVLVSGVVALTSDREATGVRASPAAGAGPLSGHPTTRSGRPTGCRTDDGAGDELPTAAPKDVEWRALDVAEVPVSASAGPLRTDGPLWWCFAHTPVGAVLAAHIIPSQMSGPHWRAVTEAQVVAGRGRDMFVFQRSAGGGSDTDTASRRRTGRSAVATYAGFSVLSYSREEASVELLLKGEQSYAATTVALRWSGGDWKVVPLTSGALHSPVETVQGTGGRLMWGGRHEVRR
ncbi:hypothetical protein ACFUIW_09035 [Streptomyces sp. NPDC057245]|uniref:hypothetical protein n=1 Tax=Streptomyces sp. NPDC057245 TaxID=3346065 RepID=UPI0036423C28